MTFGKLAKDFQSTLRSIRSFTAGQAHITDWDYDKLTWLQVELRPNDGPYEGGMFEFMVSLPKKYPREPPNVTCLTTIYHPNIDPDCEEYNVCLSLFDEWDENYGLEDVIQGLLFLMKNPNLEDPLSSYFDPCMDEEEFYEHVKQSLRGESIEDVSLQFECVLCVVEDKNAEDAKETGDKEVDSGIEDDKEGAKADCDNAQQDSVELAVIQCVNDLVDSVTDATEFPWDQPIVLDDDDTDVTPECETAVTELVSAVTESVTEEQPKSVVLEEFGWEQVIVLDDENECSENLKTEDEGKTKTKPVIHAASYYEAKHAEMLNRMNEVVEGLTDEDFVGDEDEEDEDQCDNEDEEEEEEEITNCEDETDSNERTVERENMANGLLRQLSKLDRTELIYDPMSEEWCAGYSGANKLTFGRNCTFMDPQVDRLATFVVSLAVSFIRNRLL